MDNNNSSSEDEFMRAALKEATDQHFLKESFFKEESSDDKKNTDKATDSCDKSLRPDFERGDDFKIFGVSDAFQDYISKNLSKILDKSIKFVDNLEKHISTPETQKSNFAGGIRLLSRFDTVVYDVEDIVIENSVFSRNIKRRKHRILKEDDSIPRKIKFKEAAVNPEWILSKWDTKAWANGRKEAEFRYKKLVDGTLVAQ